MMLDQEYRDIARRILDQNVVVEAGAGTGKTTLLTDRLLFLLLAGGKDGKGLDIGRVAAMTFTEKAAGEIKGRLSSRLNDILAVIDGRSLPEPRQSQSVDWLMEVKQYFKRTPVQVRQAAEAALSRMDQARIGTIHQFASTLLRAYPLEARVDPRAEVDEGTVFEELFEDEWARWLEEELGTKPPRASQWMEVLGAAPLEDVTALARELALERAAEARFGPSDRVKERMARLYENFQHLPLGKPEPGSSSRILDSIPAVASHLFDLQEAVARPPISLPPRARGDFKKERERKWPKAWEGLPGADVYEEAVELAGSASAYAEVLVSKAVDLVRPFCDVFRETYSRKGNIGFDGLLIKARALVRDRPDVRRELKSRFDALLVDEFQDTDPMQGEIILFLAEEASGSAAKWEEVRLAPGKLFLVGDPKQSIYRFRGADIRAYSRFTELVLAQGGLRCPLQTNFRSRPELLGPINAIFQGLLKEDKGLQPGHLPLHAGRELAGPSLDRAAVELVLTGTGGEERPAREAQRAEARWIASWISSHCGPAEAKGGLPAKPYRFKDVAVLFRTTTALPIYLEALKETRIPCVVESDRYFYGTQEVIDFVNLLRVLDDPQDTVSFVGLLRSPLGALDDKDIIALRAAGELDYTQEPSKGSRLTDVTYYRIKSFFALLRRFRDRVGKDPLGDFVEGLLQESFLLETCAAAYHGEQTLSNLMKLGRLASEMGERRGATLKEFIRKASRAVVESVEEGESPLVDEHLDAVRILTVHKAKGLEFPVVILPNLAAPAGGGREGAPVLRLDWEEGRAGLRLPASRAADAAMFFIEREEDRREEAERVRLLYVAMTRARERLILVGRAEGGDRTSFAGLLARAGAWPKEGEEAKELSLAEGGKVPVTIVNPSALEAPTGAVSASSRPRIADSGGLAALWKKRREEYGRRSIQAIFDSPTGYLKERDKAATDPPADALVASVSALVGQVCHRVLEEWDYSKVDELTDRIARAYQVLRQQFPVAYWSPVARESEKVLEEFLASPFAQKLAKCEILGREIPFLCEAGGRVMRGAIDLLFRSEGRLWVADYKTDRVPLDQMELHAQRYEQQGRAYVEAVERTLRERCGFVAIYLRLGRAVEVIK
jgi:ATP-dependent helicase/nuclease subunit A